VPDRGPQIRNRLAEVLAAASPARTVYRDRSAFSATERPCRVLLYGRETIHHNFENRAGRVYARTAPSVMLMEPEIFELLRVREPKKSGEYAPELEASLKAIHHAIVNDEELVALTGDSGDIAYRGFTTDFELGASMEGAMQIHFRFYYVLNPETDLA